VLGKSTDYELFWSLGFAISKENFWRIGGFDESFVGYGGEDTDFAFRAQQFGLQLYFSQAQIYHQNHPSYDPPLNWLSDIVTNAHYFKKTWQHWPMQGWLQKFSDEGYVSWSADDLTILKLPTQSEIDAALKSDAL
jgi:GT2 family glycosyltransferase